VNFAKCSPKLDLIEKSDKKSQKVSFSMEGINLQVLYRILIISAGEN
jgi:hypothetical protein